MHIKKTISMVMPCFNEEESIPVVIPRMLDSLDRLKNDQKIEDYELIVIDDKSTDRSVALLRGYGEKVRIFHTEKNISRGYGLALKTGFSQAKGQWIGFLDMDNSYRPEDISLFIEEMDRGDSDFIMGVRLFNDKGMSFVRGFGNWFYMLLAKIFYKSSLRDVCSGYRFFHRNHLKNVLNISEDGLNFSIHLTLKMIIQNVFIKQVPIHYDERLGFSKLSVVWDGLSFLKVFLTVRRRYVHAIEHRPV